jgi:hypothetical protein
MYLHSAHLDHPVDTVGSIEKHHDIPDVGENMQLPQNLHAKEKDVTCTCRI